MPAISTLIIITFGAAPPITATRGHETGATVRSQIERNLVVRRMRLFTPVRTIAAVLALGVIATACSSDGTDGGSNEKEASTKEFPYQTAIFEDIETNNYWAYLNDSDVYTGYVLGNTKCALFGSEAPTFSLIPNLAAADWSKYPVEQINGKWVAEAELQKNLKWSDGEPITAADFEFTFSTVKEVGLTENWAGSWYPVDAGETEQTGVVSVEAVDKRTVRFTFNQRPGLAIWPFSIGTASIMAEHHWKDIVDKALASKNPAKTLTSADGAGDPSCGPLVFNSREAGSYASVKPNKNWHMDGTKMTHYEGGGVKMVDSDRGINGVFGGPGEGKKLTTYTVGPYLEEEIFTLYKNQEASVLALRKGDVQFIYNSLGMKRGLQENVLSDQALQSVTNRAYGMRYIAFNFRKAPMNDKAFRQALVTIIDRKKMAEEVLGGVAYPLYTALPSGNKLWYSEEVGDQIAARYSGEDEFVQFEKAVQILADAGYTWKKKPKVTGSGENRQKVKGEGIIMPNGEPMPELKLDAPSAGYDPLRATYAKYVEGWADELGIPLSANNIAFDAVVDSMQSKKFDMYMLGFSLGGAGFPTYYESFWSSNGSWNYAGWSNKEYDKAVQEYMSAKSIEEAKQIMWQELEPILAEEVPWIFLFDTPILEFYRKESVNYPFNQTLGGIQYLNGMPDTVAAAK